MTRKSCCGTRIRRHLLLVEIPPPKEMRRWRSQAVLARAAKESRLRRIHLWARRRNRSPREDNKKIDRARDDITSPRLLPEAACRVLPTTPRPPPHSPRLRTELP